MKISKKGVKVGFTILLISLILYLLPYIIIFTIFTINNYYHPVIIDEDITNSFYKYKEDFDFINEFCLEISDGKNCSFSMINDFSYSTEEMDCFQNLELNEEQDAALENVKNSDHSPDFIKVNKTRIAYMCQSERYMYVYVLDGKKPKYFFEKSDNSNFDIYDLGNNWYMLQRH